MKPVKASKAKTPAEQAEDRLVFDKPFELQHYDLTQHAWLDSEHIHANINKAISTGGQNPNASAHASRYIFRIRYHAALDDVRANPQKYRIRYGGEFYELADYDDYNERRTIIKLTVSKIRTGTIALISESTTEDEIGQQIKTETTLDLPCIEYETTQDERADAYQIDLMLAHRLRIFRAEYSGERRVMYDGKRYRIGSVRYVGDCVDLYLGERIGDLNA